MNFKSSNRRAKQIQEIKKNMPEIEAEIVLLEAAYDKKWESVPPGLNIKEFEEFFEPEISTLSNLKRKIRLVRSYVLEVIPDYGDLMTMEDFVGAVHGGGFIDSDGGGNYATVDKMSDISIRPSDVNAETYRHDFTHVVWFNK